MPLIVAFPRLLRGACYNSSAMTTEKKEKDPIWSLGLNDEQKKAVMTTDGPVLILAGAGSGKTKTLTHRIVYLLAEKKVRPENILAVTFTNKASQEMRERVQALLEKQFGRAQALPNIGTFHSTCVRILRREIEVLGKYTKNFNILDDQDQQTILKRILKNLELSEDQIRPRAMSEVISRAKNALKTPTDVRNEAGSYYEEIAARVYESYENELVAANGLDFDDLIMLTVKIFQEHQEILKQYQNFFRYILVDEYQDTNHSQYLLVTLLAREHRNLFVIGDDYQSIYGWRQADIQNILDFEKDYPEATVITLDQNYRSTQNILDAAQGVIENNTKQRKKKLWTAGEAGEKIYRVQTSDEGTEARFVAKIAKKFLASEAEPRISVAVLYRTNAQSRSLEEAFLRLSVPYKIVGGVKFYQRKEIKDMIALVRFFINPHDGLALERIVGALKTGIGKATLEKWTQVARASSTSYTAAAYQDSFREQSGLSPRKILQLKNFLAPFAALQEEAAHRSDLTLPLFLERLATVTMYRQQLLDGTPEGEEREENVRELFSVATKFTDLDLVPAIHAFLEEVALVSDTDELSSEDGVMQVMTIHAAKGLEFDVVLVVGLEEGIFPHSRSALSQAELEEERRLMYVALTRAKKCLYLLCSDERVLYGTTQMNAPSRFLEEIPEELCVEQIEKNTDMMRPRRSFGYGKYQSQSQKTFLKPVANLNKSISSAPIGDFAKVGEVRPGDMVHHQEFGSGLIIALAGNLVTVAFKERGVKKMMLGVAPLTKI